MLKPNSFSFELMFKAFEKEGKVKKSKNNMAYFG